MCTVLTVLDEIDKEKNLWRFYADFHQFVFEMQGFFENMFGKNLRKIRVSQNVLDSI